MAAFGFVPSDSFSTRPESCIQRCSVVFVPVPNPHRCAICFRDRVVSRHNRVAIAGLSGSLWRRGAKSCCVQPKQVFYCFHRYGLRRIDFPDI
jgi:hypothetical protein